jgi:hypothetical protein
VLASQLDYVLTDDPAAVTNIQVLPPLSLSDHVVTTLSFAIASKVTRQSPSPKLNYRKTKYPEISQQLSHFNLGNTEPSTDVDAIWLDIKQKVTDAVKQHTPLLEPKGNKQKGWLTASTKKLLLEKRKAWDRFRFTQFHESYLTYAKLRNLSVNKVRRDKIEFQVWLSTQAKHNPKYFYKYVNNLAKIKQHIPSLCTNQSSTETLKESANVLANHFSSVVSEDRDTAILINSVYSESANLLATPNFSIEAVRTKLINLDINKTAGSDGLPAIVLVGLADVLSEPLSKLFTVSYSTGQFPSDWKCCHVMPRFKGGNRSLPENYRPITMLPIISKVMESLVAESLDNLLTHCNTLSNNQHGFRKGRSCITNLLTVIDNWTTLADAAIPIDAIYLDLSKAFDKVDHELLLKKLIAIGINGTPLQWFKSYLTNRSFIVRAEGALSDPHPIFSGVPQGSILGPKLFNIYINEILTLTESPLTAYADDIKIWRSIRGPEDCEILQADLDVLQDWATENNLTFNIKKCKLISIRHNTTNSYNIGGLPITCTNGEMDLGTYISDDLNPAHNIELMTKKAFTRLRFIKRNLGKFELKSFHQIYTSLIRPLVEINFQASHPLFKKDSALIESVQRKATKNIRGLSSKTYEQRLEVLNLFSLGYRRLRGDLILTHKILHNPTHPCKHLFTLRPPSGLRGHPLTLEHERTRLLCREKFLSVRVIGAWNALPTDVVLAKNTMVFKHKLEKHYALTNHEILSTVS